MDVPEPRRARSIPLESQSVLLYCSFILFGLAQLLPWNVYMKSIPYIRMRLGESPLESLVAGCMSSSYTACNFLSMLMLVGLRWDELVMNTPTRVMVGMAGNAILMVCTAVIIVPDLGATLLFALIVTITSMAGIVTSLLIKGLLGTVARFPPHLTPALLAGQALAGLFISTANVVTNASSKGSPANAVGPIAYFLAGATVLSLAFAVYLISHTRNKYFKSCMGHSSESLGGAGHSVMPFSAVMMVFRRIRWLALGITVTLGTTVSLLTTFITAPRRYPATDALKYLYTPLSFILYDAGDLVGRWVPAVRAFAGHPRSKLMLLTPYLRFLVFVPLFVLLAPVDVSSRSGPLDTSIPFNQRDAIYYFLVALFGLSNGYLNTLLLMHAPAAAVSDRPFLTVHASGSKDSVEVEVDEGREREMGGSIMGLFLNIGLLMGSLSNFLWRLVL